MQPQLDQNAAELEERLAGATATGRSADGLVTIVVGELGDCVPCASTPGRCISAR